MELLPEGLLLEAETYNALISTLRRDSRVLESFRIMDYSLLVGVHNLDLAAKEEVSTVQFQFFSLRCKNSLFFTIFELLTLILISLIRMPRERLVQQEQQQNSVLCKRQSCKSRNLFPIPRPWSPFKLKPNPLMNKNIYRKWQ